MAVPLAAGCAWSAFALARGLENLAPLTILWGAPTLVVLLLGLALSSGLCAWATARAVRAPVFTSGWLRDLFCIVVVGAVLYLAFAQPFAQLTCDFALAICAGVFALRVLAGARRGPPVIELVAFQLCLLVVLGEVGLRLLATVTGSPLLVPANAGMVELVESHRYAPGEIRWGFPCNSAGHYDDEFVPRAERTGKTIATIGDSFSVGTVPHAMHFTTVAESLLDGARVYNFGVTGVDPPHYLHMLRTEVLPLDPDLIVVDLFVGNDLVFRPTTGSGWARGWLARDNVHLCLLTHRLAAVASERRAQGDDAVDVGRPQGEGLATALIDDVDELSRRFPWLIDHRLEKPTFSASNFLGIEQRRAARVCGRASHYDACLDVVAEMQRLAQDTPFAVLLIPDEFQVEDALWRAVAAQPGEDLERDRPQRILAKALRARGIPFLDLLPILRAEPPGPDGNRHLYHLRDTHFNARGNRVAGEAIAAFVRARE